MEKSVVDAANEFLKNLEDPDFTFNMMTTRIDPQLIFVINNYASAIAEVFNRGTTKLSPHDYVTCSLIIGYLLKSHIDRYQLAALLPPDEEGGV